MLSACCTDAFLKRFHVLHPEFTLRDIREAEFPILSGTSMRKKTLPLQFFLRGRGISSYHDAGSVVMKMPLYIDDSAIPIMPNFWL